MNWHVVSYIGVHDQNVALPYYCEGKASIFYNVNMFVVQCRFMPLFVSNLDNI